MYFNRFFCWRCFCVSGGIMIPISLCLFYCYRCHCCSLNFRSIDDLFQFLWQVYCFGFTVKIRFYYSEKETKNRPLRRMALTFSFVLDSIKAISHSIICIALMVSHSMLFFSSRIFTPALKFNWWNTEPIDLRSVYYIFRCCLYCFRCFVYFNLYIICSVRALNESEKFSYYFTIFSRCHPSCDMTSVYLFAYNNRNLLSAGNENCTELLRPIYFKWEQNVNIWLCELKLSS